MVSMVTKTNLVTPWYSERLQTTFIDLKKIKIKIKN